MKTVVFGGTFDPPHEGHKNILKSIMAHGYDRAVVIPTNIPPHKLRDNRSDDFNERFENTKAFFADMENVIVSDIEHKRDGVSYTVDTLSALKEIYPDDELFLLIGSDMLFSLEKWRSFEKILSMVTVISASRTKQDIPKVREYKNYLEKKYKCAIIIYDVNVLELSSTQLRSKTVSDIKAHNEKHLSPKRLNHVISVANYAASLAPLHGIDPFEAYIAGLAHDCTKYLDDTEQLCYFEQNGIVLTEDEKRSPKIHHQISGAHFAKHSLGIQNPDVLNAIRYHTTGREGMSALEKLICLADSIEPIRSFDGVEQMREIAKTDLDRALIMSFDRLIDYVKERGLYLNEQTVKARDYERKRYGRSITNS